MMAWMSIERRKRLADRADARKAKLPKIFISEDPKQRFADRKIRRAAKNAKRHAKPIGVAA